jgi:hypothetical protein
VCPPSYECTWECRAKYTGSVPSSAIESVLESMPGSEHKNVLRCILASVFRLDLGAYFNQAASLPLSAIGCVFDNVLGSMLESIL